jgi:hypothetical protein
LTEPERKTLKLWEGPRMTERSHTGEWKTSFYKTAGDAVAEVDSLGLQPGTVVTVVFTTEDDSPALMYYFE